MEEIFFENLKNKLRVKNCPMFKTCGCLKDCLIKESLIFPIRRMEDLAHKANCRSYTLEQKKVRQEELVNVLKEQNKLLGVTKEDI